jgi:glycosyltransferase involved in cell wall biosynthesis
VLRQSVNRKALVNKRFAVQECRGDWVLLLDSDNTAFRSFLDALASLSKLHENVFYCASNAFPRFAFKALGYRPIDFEAARRMTLDGSLKRYYLINDGNYLVNRRVYLGYSSALGEPAADQADAMLVNYELLSHGGALQLLPDTAYYHRVETGSRWLNTHVQRPPVGWRACP